MLSKYCTTLVFYLLIQNISSSADLGLNLGSKAAGKLATHCIHYALRQPRVLKLNLQSSVNPWFEKIAHVTSRTKLSLSNFTIKFENDMVELALYDVVLKSTSQVNIMPLPFFLGEDTAHLYAEVCYINLCCLFDMISSVCFALTIRWLCEVLFEIPRTASEQLHFYWLCLFFKKRTPKGQFAPITDPTRELEIGCSRF